jgi:hypothetical protein
MYSSLKLVKIYFQPQYELSVQVLEATGLADCLISGHPHCMITVTNQPDENPSKASGVNGRRSPRVSRCPSILLNTSNGSDNQLSQYIANESQLQSQSIVDVDAPQSPMINVQYTQCILDQVDVPCWDETFYL